MTDFLSRLKALSNQSTNPKSSLPETKPIDDSTASTSSPLRDWRSRLSKPLLGFPKDLKFNSRRWLPWIALGLVAGSTGMTVYSVKRTFYTMDRDLPTSGDVLTYARQGSLTIKAADGSILQQIGDTTRQKITIDEMPRRVVEAFVAAEDKNFYNHNGVDYRAIARAMWKNVLAGEVVEGGSTITQQVARIVFLSQERSYERKLKEAMLAQKIERELTKEQILESYLNLVFLGSNAYGVADAAWIFFGKTIDQLTLSEIATIAGLPPAPSNYSPLVDPDLATERRDIVLGRMLEAGFISESEMQQAIDSPLTLNPKLPRNINSSSPFFTTYIQQQLPLYVSQEEIERGGLTIETTLNPKWQKYGEQTIKNAVENYGSYENFTQAALVAIDPKTGAIKVMVGGRDATTAGQFNRATQAQRQPGSTFKAFVYTTAIAAGFSPYKGYEDAPLIVDGYEPQNYGKTYRGSVSMRDALISSINIVAVKTLIEVGFDPVINLAKKMGIESDLIAAYSLALGTSEVTLLELTSAYGTLANQGNYIQPHGIVRVINRYGQIVYQSDFASQRAVDADTAAIVTWMLRGVITSGTGANANLGRPVAGKTGTSEQKRDLWFVGYIPQMVTGVWLGNDDNSPTWGVSATAARTWHDFMSQITPEIPEQGFPELPDLNAHEATIEAQPVRPRSITTRSYQPTESSNSEDAPSSNNSSYYSEPAPAQSSQQPSSQENYSREERASDYKAPPPDSRNEVSTPAAPPEAPPDEPAAPPIQEAPPEPPAEPAAPPEAPPPVEAADPPPQPEAPPEPVTPASGGERSSTQE